MGHRKINLSIIFAGQVVGAREVADNGVNHVSGTRCKPCLRYTPSESGAGDRSRTYDLLITNELLYQLSYTGMGREW